MLPYTPIDVLTNIVYSIVHHRTLWFFVISMLLLIAYIVPVQSSESFSYVIKHLPSTSRDDKYDIPEEHRKPGVSIKDWYLPENMGKRMLNNTQQAFKHRADGHVASVFTNGKHYGTMPTNMKFQDGKIEFDDEESYITREMIAMENI